MKKNFFKILKNSQFAKLAKFRTKTQFLFLGKLYRNFFLLYTFIILVILHTKFGLIWTTPWPDEKELFLKFSKIIISRNSQNSVWKIIFFPRQNIPKFLFALHSHYTGDTPYRVRFDVDNSLPDEKDLFLKFLYTGDTPYRVRLDLDNSLTRWQRPIFRIPFSQKSKSSVWNSNFFAGQAIAQILFALHCHYTFDTQYRDLDNSLTRWKIPFFKILFFCEIQKVPYVILTFFPDTVYQNFFALHSHYTVDTPYRIWFGLDNSLTRWKIPILKFIFFAKFKKFRM